MLTDNELQRIDERLCGNGIFAPLIWPSDHVTALPFEYVAKNGTIFVIGTRGQEARLYSREHPDGVGERALDDLEIAALVEKALATAEVPPGGSFSFSN